MVARISNTPESYLEFHQAVRARLVRARSFLARHVLEEAMLLCVAGWSLMWADALSLVTMPIWIPIACFYAGLALIPFLRKRDML
jgi:hypothetical protein